MISSLTFLILGLGPGLLMNAGCSEGPREKPFADGINHITPIRLKFDPPVALVPPSNDKQDYRARDVLALGSGGG